MHREQQRTKMLTIVLNRAVALDAGTGAVYFSWPGSISAIFAVVDAPMGLLIADYAARELRGVTRQAADAAPRARPFPATAVHGDGDGIELRPLPSRTAQRGVLR